MALRPCAGQSRSGDIVHPVQCLAREANPDLTPPPLPFKDSADIRAAYRSPDNGEMLLKLLEELRREFWIELLSFPVVQDYWLQKLERVAKGELEHNGPMFFVHPKSPATVQQMLSDLEQFRAPLVRATCDGVVFKSRREIAERIVDVPMLPEKALLWAKAVTGNSATLSQMERYTEVTLKDCGGSPSNFDKSREQREQLQKELGGSADVVKHRVSRMLQSRDAYLVLRDELFERNAHLADKFLRWRSASPTQDADDLTQEARIGLLKAVERAPTRLEFPFRGTAHVYMDGEVKDFLGNSSKMVRIPKALRSIAKTLEERRADASGSRFLRVDEVGHLKGLDSEVSQAVHRASLPLSHLSNSPDSRIVDIKAREESYDPVAILLSKEATEQLHRALESLTPEEQVIVELRFGLRGSEAKTFREVGEAIGRSELAAFRKVNALLQKLRAIILTGTDLRGTLQARRATE